MKNKFLILFVALSPLLAKAQYFDSGLVYRLTFYDHRPPSQNYISEYRIIPDSNYNDTQYYHLEQRSSAQLKYHNGKLWMNKNDIINRKYKLYYDFNMQEEDTIKLQTSWRDESTAVVDSIRWIQLFKHRRKAFYVRCIKDCDEPYLTIIDSLGSLAAGLFYEDEHIFEESYELHLICNGDDLYFYRKSPKVYTGDSTCNPVYHKSIDNHSLPSLNIYPIPCSEYIQIEFPELPSGAYQLDLYNAFGVLLRQIKLMDLEEVYQLNTIDLPDGVYFLISTDKISGKKLFMNKLLVEH